MKNETFILQYSRISEHPAWSDALSNSQKARNWSLELESITGL